MLNAVVLAGTQPIKNSDSNENKALLQINGKSMIEYVIDALKKARDIEKVVVVGPERELAPVISGKVDALIDSQGTIMQNLLKGVGYLGADRYILACSSDIPMITAGAINDFVARARETGADFCYPIVEKSTNNKKFPEAERTYVKIKEGSFTGGNIFYINPLVVGRSIGITEKLLDARKNPVKMARLLSFGFMLGLATGSLTIHKAEQKFSKLMGIKARAIISEYPEIGNDVDKPGDVIFAAAHLGG